MTVRIIVMTIKRKYPYNKIKCKKHRAYKAKRKPVAECCTCWMMWKDQVSDDLDEAIEKIMSFSQYESV